MRKCVSVLMIIISTISVMAQQQPVEKANYQLASRYSSAKLEKMVFSTSVDSGIVMKRQTEKNGGLLIQ